MTRLSAVLLAAGRSQRLGRPKQLLLWRGEALVRRAAQAALEAGVDELVVVVGAEGEAVARALEGLDLKIVENARFEEGIGSSITAGVRAISGDSVLLLLADQPGVDAALLRALITAKEAGHGRVACGYRGVAGVPAIFSSAGDLEALRALSGDEGARALLRRTDRPTHVVPAEAAGYDIDEASDWERWQAEADA